MTDTNSSALCVCWIIWVYHVVPINTQIVIVSRYTPVKISFWLGNYIKLLNCYIYFKEKCFGKIKRKYTIEMSVKEMVFGSDLISTLPHDKIRVDKNSNFKRMLKMMPKRSIPVLKFFEVLKLLCRLAGIFK